ncbi:hypothetical protein MHYP_G00008630 [Metynnis hypsauchen]
MENSLEERKKERKNKFNKDEEAEKEQGLINKQPAKVEEGAHVLGLPVGLASNLESVSAEMLEATAPPPQDNLTKEEDAAVQQMEQLLKAEIVQITVADEAAAEATNSTMGVCLEGSEEKHLEKDVISIIEAEAQPEATENRLNVCLEEQAPENQRLSEWQKEL